MKGSVPIIALALFALLAAGCASKDVNPPKPRSHTGYVDFYTDTDYELCWQVDRVEGAAGNTSRVFEQFEPMDGKILRLAFAPGRYQFKVTFLNCVVTRPATVEVEVRDGMIVPVQVTLIKTGESLVETKEARVGGTVYGRYGRGTKIRAAESAMFQLNAEPQAPSPYQLKERTAYAAAANQ